SAEVRSAPAGVTLEAMAATRPSAQTSLRDGSAPSPRGPSPPDGVPVPMPPSSMPLALERPASARTVSGPVRSGRRTKLLVKHLLRGEIALIDHLDIDRVSAEELIAASAVAVLNCSPSSSGSYPNLGPQLLVEAGILLLDLADDALFDT